MDWRLGVGPAAFGAWMVLAPAVVAAQAPAAVNARVEISAAVAGSSATIEAIERQAAARDQVRLREIAALQDRLTEAETRGAAEVAALQVELIDAREALVADLASRDRAYALEIDLFRQAVTSIASTPEGAAALARVNAGDRVGGVAVLDGLRQARDTARRARAEAENKIASAAEAREIAAVAQDALDRHDPAFPPEDVIARYEEVTRLDPGVSNDWMRLMWLYGDIGRNADALAAADRLVALASSDSERSHFQALAGMTRLKVRDYDGALAGYLGALELDQRLADANPDSVEHALNLSVSLQRVADALLGQGDLDRAMESYQRGLDIVERLSAADPASDRLSWYLSLALGRMGDLLKQMGEPDGALAHYERSLEITTRLSEADPTSAERASDVRGSLDAIERLQRDRDPGGALARYQRRLEIDERRVAIDPASSTLARILGFSYKLVGDALRERGDSNGALEHYRQSLAISDRLLAIEPSSEDQLLDVDALLRRMGDLQLALGDHDGALLQYQRSLEIRERMSAADPASAGKARDVSFSLERVGDVLLSQGDRDGALSRYRRAMEVAERLSLADPTSADHARDVFVYSTKVANITRERRHWERALAILQELEASGTLSAADRPFIAQIEGLLAEPISPSN